MIWEILTPDVLVTLAGGCFILGYLIINQVILRWVLLLGSVIYIVYYWTAAETPLWGAIYLSVAMIGANLVGIAGLYAQNSKIIIPSAYRDLYSEFSNLPPGDFRVLMLAAKRYHLDKDMRVSDEGQPIRKLYYIISGGAEVTKQGAQFVLPPRVLVGEVAFLRKSPSAATTRIKAGSEVLEWDVPQLEARSVKSSRFQLALQAMISGDLVEKVALAVAPQGYTAPRSPSAPPPANQPPAPTPAE